MANHSYAKQDLIKPAMANSNRFKGQKKSHVEGQNIDFFTDLHDFSPIRYFRGFRKAALKSLESRGLAMAALSSYGIQAGIYQP